MPEVKSSDSVPSLQPAELAPATTDASLLTAPQLHALFDILTHYQLYTEVERFKVPSTVADYGYPFGTRNGDGELSHSSVSSAPLLAALFRSAVLPCPGVRDLSLDFWSLRFQNILGNLGEAELSESYDKGALGTRKTLATAASVIHENLSRGNLGGVPRGGNRNLNRAYDSARAEDVVQAWEDVVHEIVYGSLIDELFDCAAEKQSLEEHSPAAQVAIDYIIIHIATFIHQILILSPEGPYLLKLAENVHRLIPYAMVRQTLRIGNAATMIHGILRIFLAKMSVGAMSNWLGLTQNADDGMNLLQRIISLVLSWDSSEFRKSAEKIERLKDGPSKEHLATLKKCVAKSREEHEALRQDSMTRKVSIVAAIFEDEDPELLSSLSDAQHSQCLEYYSALLSVRDRDEITKSLCSQSPDHFTQAVRDATGGFEPIIRVIHEQVDLREPLVSAETFLNDLIATSKMKNGNSSSSYSLWRKVETKVGTVPSVEDYVSLLRRNRQLLYDFLHEVASKCPDTADDFRAYLKKAVKGFQASSSETKSHPPAESVAQEPTVGSKQPGGSRDRSGAAGSMSGQLQTLFATLPGETQQATLKALDAHASYLSTLEDLSLQRMQQVLDNLAAADDTATNYSASTGSMSGPGMFLSRWQAILDETVITPGPAGGALRSGKDVKGSTVLGKTGAMSSKDSWDPAALAAINEKDIPQPPDVQDVVAALRPAFEGVLADMTKGYIGPK